VSEFIGRNVWLRAELKRLSEIPVGTDEPDAATRIKFASQLAVVVNFIDSDPWLEPLIDPLREGLAALREVQRGRHVPWLEPARKPGAPPVAIENAHLRGRYAAVADFIMDRGGMTETQAVSFVGRHGKVERLMPPKPPSAPNREVVRDWRQAALANAGRDHQELRAGFDHLRAWMELQWRRDPGNPVAKAKQWLKVIDRCPVKS
jgi:hypothetical protein